MPMQGGGTITLQQIRNEWEAADQGYWIPNNGTRGNGAGYSPPIAYPSYNLNAYAGTTYFYNDGNGNSPQASFPGSSISIMMFYGKASYPAWNCNCDCANCTNCDG